MKTEEKIVVGAFALLLMYRLKHILEPKNVLGGDRTPTPDPQHVPADQTVYGLRGETTSVFMADWTGTLRLSYRYGGIEYYQTYAQSSSGTFIHITADGNSSLLFTGAVTRIDTSAISVVARFIAGNTLQQIRIENSGLEYIDLRNCSDTVNTSSVVVTNTNTLYAKATTGLLGITSKQIIDKSTVSDGVLWINPDDTYAADVIAAAEAKGWTVYYL